MKKSWLIVVALITAISFVSCKKDELYYVTQAENRITSMVIMSDDYTSGLPSITTNNIYVYDYTGYNSYGSFISGEIESSSIFAISDIEIKINPSDASLDGVSWQIIRRAAATKALESEQIFEGEFTATRSETYSELVTFSIESDDEGFFESNGEYVYSVVALYDDGVEVSSDVACVNDGEIVTISELFMGTEVDGEVMIYGDDVVLTSNYEIVDKPQMYGILESGEILSFEQMGIDETKYSLTLASTPGSTTETLDVTVLDPLDADLETADQWLISINDRFDGYNYNELNGYVGLQFELCNSEGTVIDDCTVNYYTYMDDAVLTNAATVTKNVSPFTVSVFSESVTETLFLERLLGSTSTNSYSIASLYCNTSLYAYTPKYYIDDVVSSSMSLDYSDSDSIKLNVNLSLSTGVYMIKLELTSKLYSTVLTEIITLTVI